MGVLLIDWLIFFVLFELFASIIPLMGLSVGLSALTVLTKSGNWLKFDLIWFFFLSVVVWSITSHRLVLCLMMATILIAVEGNGIRKKLGSVYCFRIPTINMFLLNFDVRFVFNPFRPWTAHWWPFNPSSFKFIGVIFHFIQLNFSAGTEGVYFPNTHFPHSLATKPLERMSQKQQVNINLWTELWM